MSYPNILHLASAYIREDKLLSYNEVQSYRPDNEDLPIPDDSDFKLLLLASTCYTLLSLSSMPLANIETPYVALLEKLARANFPRAWYELGLMYFHGKFVPKDDDKSFQYHKYAAEAGMAEAQFELYVFLSRGIGCKRDDQQAVEWNRKAAIQEIDRAVYNEATFHAEGAHGYPKDLGKAVSLYEQASELGNWMASKNLGIMYYTGAGVARDIPKGEQYLKKAARQNWEFADALPKLMKKLDATKRRRKSK